MTMLKERFLFVVAPAIGFVTADQWLKAWTTAHVRLLTRKPVLGQTWLVVSRFLNRGLMFDRYSNLEAGEIETFTRYLPTVVLVGLLAFAVARWRKAGKLERFSFALMLGGGASNLWDHWRSDFVVDSLQLYIGRGQYLPFNIADAGISLGAALLFIVLVREMTLESSAHDEAAIRREKRALAQLVAGSKYVS